MERYLRAEVLRILRITARQLAGWERAGLIAAAESYSFYDLLQIKKLSALRAKKVRPATIRASIDAMQRQVSGMENPLLEAGISSHGSRLTFRHQGHELDPLAGQFLLDFDRPKVVEARAAQPRVAENAADLFVAAVAMEESPERQQEAMEAYGRVLELNPKHAAACINLGTIYYNQQNYRDAERYYRRAIEIDARYALAYFDLGNVLDETGRLMEAVEAYRTALTISPSYADAHYNLALAYERLRRPRKALTHWRAYVKMDPVGAWSNYARGQIQKILEAEKLHIVWRRPPTRFS
ncbi:MAG TPA: tetratricopeptide repeat protein [Terriglobales bacterium]|nr:tetratricopeptide repeat protein [Terriglobales bacterium]